MASLLLQPDGTAGKDTWLASNVANNNFGVNNTITIGRDSSGNQRVGLLRFDISSLPAGITITAATLTLTFTAASGTQNIVIYRCLVDWDEGTGNNAAGDASWAERKSGVAWNTAGARGSATDRAAVATATITNPGVSVQNADVLADVQAWYGGASNFGWVIDYSDNTGTSKIKTTASSDDTTAANRPQLLIVYEIPVPTPDSSVGVTVVPAVVVGANPLVPIDANAVGVTVSPTLVKGSVVVVPASITAVGEVTGPTIEKGSAVSTPQPAETIGTVVDPIPNKGSAVVEATAEVTGDVAGPTLEKSSAAASPQPASAVAVTVGGIPSGGPALLEPDPSMAVGEATGPAVVKGSIVVVPVPIMSIAEALFLSVIRGSVAVTPQPVAAVGVVVGPVVVIAGGDIAAEAVETGFRGMYRGSWRKMH